MSDHLALEMVKMRVLGKPYSKWRAILSELGGSDTMFLVCLEEEFGIAISKREDPMLYLVQDTQQMRLLMEDGVPSPTMLQIMLTSKAYGLSEADAIQKWTSVMQDKTIGGN